DLHHRPPERPDMLHRRLHRDLQPARQLCHRRQPGRQRQIPAAPQAQQAITVSSAPKQSQSITFTTPASGSVGGSATLSATGGGSGNPVVFTVDPNTDPKVCDVPAPNGTTVNYTAAGTCVIDANQAGNATYADAPTVIRKIKVNDGTTQIP